MTTDLPIIGTPAPPGYTMRAASQADAGRIAELHASRFHRGWKTAEISALLSDDCVFALVIDLQDRRSGLAGVVIARSAAAEAEILTLATARPHERRGIAAALMTHACRFAAARGAAKVFLEVAAANQAARALYRHSGFGEVAHRPRYYGRDEDGDAIILCRALKAHVDAGASGS